MDLNLSSPRKNYIMGKTIPVPTYQRYSKESMKRGVDGDNATVCPTRGVAALSFQPGMLACVARKVRVHANRAEKKQGKRDFFGAP